MIDDDLRKAWAKKLGFNHYIGYGITATQSKKIDKALSNVDQLQRHRRFNHIIQFYNQGSHVQVLINKDMKYVSVVSLNKTVTPTHRKCIQIIKDIVGT